MRARRLRRPPTPRTISIAWHDAMIYRAMESRIELAKIVLRISTYPRDKVRTRTRTSTNSVPKLNAGLNNNNNSLIKKKK